MSKNSRSSTRMSRQYDCFLYYNTHSYHSQKIILALSYYKLKYNSQEINTLENEQYKPWFVRINPDASLPTLRHGNRILINTLHILEYLENYMAKDFRLMPLEHFHRIKRFMLLVDSVDMDVLRYHVLGEDSLAPHSLIP
ncbi:unnamed protein product [Gordionus sp. m RMFG-2023]